jgi:hypothetical protein
MSEFPFTGLVILPSDEVLKSGFFLCVLHADKIPPHVGCIIAGQFYSLKVSGKDESVDVSTLLKAITLKKVPTLFVGIKKEIPSALVEHIYGNYTSVVVGQNTCLSPVIDLFECQGRVKKLSDLLRLLQEESLLKEVFKLHLKEDYDALPYYSSQDIEQRLLNLTDVKRR